ncbi:response regulator transcription factor [Nocardioides cavernaquae]|uniref:response regulator transcription factor n=1 Tax=Nocardioides cavernaquae TaxID=2321396 RepID=UPI0011C355E1|nr:helix-turn-helix transcriptional regulator [Nocardioides cavernaquae]
MATPGDQARRTLDLLRNQIETGRLDAAAGTAARLLFIAPDPLVRAEVESALGVMLQRVGRVVESRDHFLFAASLTDNPGLRASYLAQASEVQFLGGDLTATRTTANQALELGERSGNAAAVCESLANLALVAQSEGYPGLAVDLARRSSRLGSIAPHSGPRSGWLRPLPVLPLAAAMVDLDLLADADRLLSEALASPAVAETAAHRPWLLGLRGIVRLLAGDWDRALMDAHSNLAEADRSGSLAARPWGWGVAAIVESLRGNASGATTLLDAAGANRLGAFGRYGEEWLLVGRATAAQQLPAYRQTLTEAWYRTRSHRWMVIWRPLAPALVRAAVAGGDLELAREVSLEAAEGARRAGGVASADASALQCAGLLSGDIDTLLSAVERYRSCGRPFALGQACLDAARGWIARGRPADAVVLLREATDIFHGLRAREPLIAAGLLLARHTGATTLPVVRVDPLAPLTRAERAVAIRAGQGLTNPQIAAELFLSARTVQAHLSSTYAKLTISSRVQLAGLVAAGVADTRNETRI